MAQALYLNLILVLWRGMEMIWGQNRGNKVFPAFSFDIIQGFFTPWWCRGGLAKLGLVPLHQSDKWGRGWMITPQIIPAHDGEKPGLLEQWRLPNANVLVFFVFFSRQAFNAHVGGNKEINKHLREKRCNLAAAFSSGSCKCVCKQ